MSTENAIYLSQQWLLCDMFYCVTEMYRQTFNIRCTLASNKLYDHSDVVGASPADAAPTTSSFSTGINGLGKKLQDEMRNI